jgi:hypothetical protein
MIVRGRTVGRVGYHAAEIGTLSGSRAVDSRIQSSAYDQIPARRSHVRNRQCLILAKRLFDSQIPLQSVGQLKIGIDSGSALVVGRVTGGKGSGCACAGESGSDTVPKERLVRKG